MIIESVVDEEGGGNAHLLAAIEGHCADVAIVTEPTSLEIRPIGMGFMLACGSVRGIPCMPVRSGAVSMPLRRA